MKSAAAEEAIKLLEDDVYVVNRLEGWLADIKSYQTAFACGIDCLLFLVNRFKKADFKRSRVQLYRSAYQLDFMTSEFFQRVMYLIRYLTATSTMELLKYTKQQASEIMTEKDGLELTALIDKLLFIMNEDNSADLQQERLNLLRRSCQTFFHKFFG